MTGHTLEDDEVRAAERLDFEGQVAEERGAPRERAFEERPLVGPWPCSHVREERLAARRALQLSLEPADRAGAVALQGG